MMEPQQVYIATGDRVIINLFEWSVILAVGIAARSCPIEANP